MDGIDEGHKSLVTKQQEKELKNFDPKPSPRNNDEHLKDRFAFMKVDYALEQAVDAIQAMEVDVSASQVSIQSRFSKHFKVNPSTTQLGLISESQQDNNMQDSQIIGPATNTQQTSVLIPNSPE